MPYQQGSIPLSFKIKARLSSISGFFKQQEGQVSTDYNILKREKMSHTQKTNKQKIYTKRSTKLYNVL